MAVIDHGAAGRGKIYQPEAVIQHPLHITAVHTRGRPYGVYPVIFYDVVYKSCYLALVLVGGAQSGGKIIPYQIIRIGVVIQASVVILGEAPLSAKMCFFYQPMVAHFLITAGGLCIFDTGIPGPEQFIELWFFVSA